MGEEHTGRRTETGKDRACQVISVKAGFVSYLEGSVVLWSRGGDKDIWSETPPLWLCESFWIFPHILGVSHWLTWKIPVPRVRDDPLWLIFWSFEQCHKSHREGMLPSIPFTVLNLVTRYSPQPNNSLPPVAHGIDCTSKLLMLLTGEVAIFHVMPSHTISFTK